MRSLVVFLVLTVLCLAKKSKRGKDGWTEEEKEELHRLYDNNEDKEAMEEVKTRVAAHCFEIDTIVFCLQSSFLIRICFFVSS